MGGESVFKDSRTDENARQLAFLTAKNGEISTPRQNAPCSFGEYVPYYETLKKFGVKKIVSAVGNFTRGKRGKLLRFQSGDASKPKSGLG
jgi:hypothetical protein